MTHYLVLRPLQPSLTVLQNFRHSLVDQPKARNDQLLLDNRNSAEKLIGKKVSKCPEDKRVQRQKR